MAFVHTNTEAAELLILQGSPMPHLECFHRPQYPLVIVRQDLWQHTPRNI